MWVNRPVTIITCILYIYTSLLLISMLWHRQAIFDSKRASCLPLLNVGFEPGSLEPNLKQTECPLTNRLSYWGSSEKLELNSSCKWSMSIQPTRSHCRLAFAPGSGDIHFVNFDALTQASDYSFDGWIGPWKYIQCNINYYRIRAGNNNVLNFMGDKPSMCRMHIVVDHMVQTLLTQLCVSYTGKNMTGSHHYCY